MADIVLAEKEKEMEKKGVVYLESCKRFIIKDSNDYTLADTARANGKYHIKGVEQFLDPHIETAFKAHRALTTDKKKLCAPVLEGRKILGRKMEKYDAEIAHQRQIEEDKLRKEAQAKAEKEEAKRLREEAKELKKEGDTAGAEALREEAKNPVVDPVSINPDILPSTPKTKTFYKDDWDIEIKDKDMIPPDYMEVNEAMIKKTVRATKGKVAIPGVKIIPKRIPV